MKKLTFSVLDELAKSQELLTELEMKSLIAGGDGTYDSPYSLDEFDSLMNTFQWTGGYVEYMGFVAPSTFIYGSQYNGSCIQYNCSVAEFAQSLISSGMEQCAVTILSSLPYAVGGCIGYILQEMNDCKAQMLSDVITSGQGNKLINYVVTPQNYSSATTDCNYTWNAYDAETGRLITSYTFNMITGKYTKNEDQLN